jgi:hypothetical protein
MVCAVIRLCSELDGPIVSSRDLPILYLMEYQHGGT